MKKLVILSLLLILSSVLFSQNQANNWYFGNKAGITFNSGVPVALTGSQMNAWEGVATISDPSGMLLFYTDGIKVWNRNHVQMTNGSGLLGDPSSAQSGVIVPKPGNPNLYYIFSVPMQGGSVITPARLYYSLVNMNLSGGLGDVVHTEKNVNISPSNRVQEKVTAVLHCNGKDIWVIAHEYGSNKFLVYLVTATTTPTLMSTQAIGESWAGNTNASIGILKASSDGRKIAETGNSNEKAQILNFDNSTGQLSNPVTLTNLKWCYGVEFSPNNNFLYISTWYFLTPKKIISQYNLNAANINASRFDIITLANVGSLQRGPDGKIYVARDTDDDGVATEGKQHLGVISNPENLGAACGYIELGVDLGGNEASPANGRLSRFGLPNFIQSYFEPPNNWTYTDTCLGNPTHFFADIQSQYDSVRWNFDGLGSSTSLNPSFIFPAVGSYTVDFYVIKRCTRDTITKTFQIKDAPFADIIGTTSVCPNTNHSYNVVNNTNYSYQWSITANGTISTATNTSQVSVNWGASGTGSLFVTITDNNGGCISDTSLIVTISNNLNVSISPINPSICPGEPITLTASGATQYTWSPGTALSATTGASVTASPLSNITYTVTGTDGGGCIGNASVSISIHDADAAFSINDITQCLQGNSFIFTPTGSVGGFTHTWNFGDGSPVSNTQNPTYSYTNSGNYTVMHVVEQGACRDTILQTIDVFAAITDINFTSLLKCYNGTDGTITANPTGGLAPYGYLWSSNAANQASQTAVNLGAGTYTVTVTDANSCKYSESVTLNNPTQITATITKTDVKCFGESNGTASATATGGTGTYTYDWFTNTGLPANPNNLINGNYIASITDGNGCSISSPFSISQPSILNATVVGSNISCFGLADGTATATVSGGTGAGTYSYTWSPNGGSNAIANGLAAGSYTVSVTDANSCKTTVMVTITEPSELTADLNITNVNCNGGFDGSATVTAHGGTPSYSYVWSPVGGTNAIATGLAAGDYTVTVTDSRSCKTTAAITILQSSAFSVSITSNVNVSCFGGSNGSATVMANGGTGAGTYIYIWSSGETSETASNLSFGNYQVTVKDANGCEATASTLITQPNELTATINSSNVNCNGGANGSANVVVNGGVTNYTYNWAPNGETISNITNLNSGDYSVTVTDANGCTIIKSTTIIEPSAIVLNSTWSNNVTCFGYDNGKINISASGGTGSLTYTVENGNTNTTGYFTSLTEGQYTVTVTDLNGCTLIGQPINITQPSKVTINSISNNDISCFGMNDGSITVSASGGIGILTYTLDGFSNTTGQFNDLSGGHYTVSATDENTCYDNGNASIAEPQPLITEIISEDKICIGKILNLYAQSSGGTTPYTINWNSGETTQSISLTPISTNTYYVTVIDAHGCKASNSKIVEVNPPLQINLNTTNDTICPNEPASITITVSGGNGDPYTITMNGNTASNPMIVYPAQTTTYNFMVEDNCGTPPANAQTTITVMGIPNIQFNADPTEGCQPLKVNFTEISPNQGQTYSWDFGDASTGNYSTAKNPTHIYETSGLYDVTLMIKSEFGCEASFSFNDMITVHPTPIANFSLDPAIASIVEPIIYFENLSQGANNYFWSFGDGDSSSYKNPVHNYIYTGIGIYPIQLVAVTEFGCSDTINRFATINEEFTFYAPTAFSPDEDGLNDVFNVVGVGIDSLNFHMMIFDRWGEPIFETHDLYLGWNGIIKNTKMGETGTYVWMVFYKNTNGAKREKKGVVTLIR